MVRTERLAALELPIPRVDGPLPAAHVRPLTDWLKPFNSSSVLAASLDCPMVSGALTASALVAPRRTDPLLRTRVAAQTLPVELMVQTPPSVLENEPLGMLNVPLTMPAAPPRMKKVPVKP